MTSRSIATICDLRFLPFRSLYDVQTSRFLPEKGQPLDDRHFLFQAFVMSFVVHHLGSYVIINLPVCFRQPFFRFGLDEFLFGRQLLSCPEQIVPRFISGIDRHIIQIHQSVGMTDSPSIAPGQFSGIRLAIAVDQGTPVQE